MSQQPFNDLENILRQLVAEHQKLLGHLEAQQKAMKTLNTPGINAAVAAQEASRLQILSLDAQRKAVTTQLSREMRLEGEPTISRLAALGGPRSPRLLQLRDELRGLIQTVRNRTQIGARLAGAMLGHLNTTLRLLAGAVEGTGVYNARGVPRLAGHIGVMNAVG